MKAKIVTNNIGEVKIYELLGSLKGASSKQFFMETKSSLNAISNPFSALFNTQGLKEMDQMGADAILETSRKARKCAVITRDTHTAEMLLENRDNNLCIFEKPEDAIFFLRYELALGQHTEDSERREYPRLQVALPVRVGVPQSDVSTHCLMVATNLSFTGMFIQFMDSTAEIGLRKSFNLYELPCLDFKIRLTSRDVMSVRGKVVHVDLSHKGMGVEFLELTEPAEWVLRKFIDTLAQKQVPSLDKENDFLGGG